MSDYDEIKETIFHYFEGYQAKDRTRLERAFALDVAHIIGYAKNGDGDHIGSIGVSSVEPKAFTGGDVEFIVYEGEGHGFRDPANQLDEYSRTERFLAAFHG